MDPDQISTDSAEFIELYDGGVGNTDLTGLVLVLYNGSDNLSYRAFDLDGQSTDGDGYFVLCGNAANVANCDLDVSPNTNLIQNGEDAVVLLVGDAVNYPNDTALPAAGDIVDAIVYETGNDADSGLLVLLNGGQSVVNEDGGGDQDNHSNSRVPDGGTPRNTDTFVQQTPTPGQSNVATSVASDVVINEVDADTPGSDALEFVELYDGGTGNTDLTGLVVVFYNGSDDASYQAFDLDGFSTDANGFFLLGNTGVTPTPSIIFSNNTLQNGADAVALYAGDATDFPNDTPVTTTNLMDAIVYDTNDSDDAALLVLLNAAQPQVNEDDGGDQDNHSNQRVPNGSGGQRNTDSYTQVPPTPGAENVPAQVTAEIFEIQGSGLVSPFEGAIATTENNIVTCLAPNGFFIQTPTARTDGNVMTSDGIFVFTDGAPSVAVGDLVDVTGQVVEFFEFTELSNGPTVTFKGTGTLPAAVVFDSTTPSPDPNTPSCGVNNFECFEGMLIEVSGSAVSSPNQDFGLDPIAEIHIVAGPDRAFREPGIEFPGLVGLPVWDGNPEVFELDPDKLGLANQIIPAGSSFDATGVLGFEFGDYELWPNALTITAATVPVAVRPRAFGEFTIGSLNLFRLFDDVDDPADGARNDAVVDAAEYLRRRTKLARYIVEVLRAPDILAVQEVEKIEVLQALAADISTLDPNVNYTAFLIEGNDIGTIDVGFLVEDSVQVDAVTQLGKTETFVDPTDSSVDILHDRPPLLLEGNLLFNGTSSPITVMALHNRSLSGITDPADGERVRKKRLEQAQSIAQKVQDLQTADPNVRLVLTGDLNAFEFTDGYVDVVGRIAGNFVDADDLVMEPADLVNPNLTNQVLSLPADERYSFIFDGNAQVLDHALTSDALQPFVSGFQYARGNADAAHDLINDDTTPLRASDHDGLVLYLDPNRLVVINDEISPMSVLPTFTPGDNTFQFMLSMTNTSSETISAPLFVSIDLLLPAPPDVEVDNSDNPPERGVGSIYDYSTSLGGDGQFAPGETRDDKLWKFKLSGVFDFTFFANVYGVLPPTASTLAKSSESSSSAPFVFVVSAENGTVEISRNPTDVLITELLPEEFSLEQNYPNPFNPETVIRYQLPQASQVKLSIHNLLGQEIRSLVNGERDAGYHAVTWNGKDNAGIQVASGVYVYRIQAGNFTEVKKLMLLR